MTIAYFKAYSDEEVKQVGYNHDAEGLIAFLADENRKPGTMSASPEEFERVAGYIRSHY